MGTSLKQQFDLSKRVTIITGGAGLLGQKHAEAISEMGGIPVLFDLDNEKVKASAEHLAKSYGINALGLVVDITNPDTITNALSSVLEKFGKVNILINNAARNPKVEESNKSGVNWSRFENYPLEIWKQDLNVGLTGAFLCSQIIGNELAQQGGGVILNIASDLAVIAPDQRIYKKNGLPDKQQPTKPVSYSVVKTGLIGLTKFLATYWADKGVRVNSISPGGVYADQDPEFVQRLTNLIPLGRMAHEDEYKAAVIFLVSDASSYMTGANLVIDGGRSCW